VMTSTPDSNPDNDSDAVVVVSGAAIPTLSVPMLGVLALALAVLGMAALRHSPRA